MPLPAMIQAEDNINYHDSDAGIVGGAYRDEDTDIAGRTNGNPSHEAGWAAAGK